MMRPFLAFFAMVLCLVFAQTYWFVRERYNSTALLAVEVKHLKARLQREQLASALQAEQFERFRQEVAATLPEALRGVTDKAAQYPLRNLASVAMRGQNEPVQELVASTLFETGKLLFRSGDYVRANRMFRKIIDTHGYSMQATEAYFLLVEGQYLIGDFDAATETINHMVELFPESELTGFALIRLGEMFKIKNRYEDAIQIYRTVLKSFPYRTVAAAAERKLRDMEP